MIDINGDNVITSADVSQITNYVMASILDLEPEVLGCVSGIGEPDTYLLVVYETITP